MERSALYKIGVWEGEVKMKYLVATTIFCGIFAILGYLIFFAPIYTPTDSMCMNKITEDQHIQNETQIIRFHVYAKGENGVNFHVVAREMCGGAIENTTDKNGISYLWLNPSQRYALTFFNESCTLITPYDFRKDNDYNIFVKNCDVK